MRLDESSIRGATVAQIEAALERRGGAGRRVLALMEQDERAGVRQLAVRERARFRERQKERRRARTMRDLEQRYRAEGAQRLAGVDEVGRGCLAGPVVAAAVVLPDEVEGLDELDDSKVLEPECRERLRERIVDVALDWSVAAVDARRIDEINILEASMEAMRLCLAELEPAPDLVLVDGNRPPTSGLREITLVGGDARSVSIAAASVVAKVHRDGMMVDYDRQFPGYAFASNKGYAAPDHREALQTLGPCDLHRRSFSPLAQRDQLTLELEEPSTGRQGEELAATYLESEGYRILARRYRVAGGELDLIAQRGTVIAFVEVKTSHKPSHGEERVDRRKQRRLQRAAAQYMERHAPQKVDFRFDVIAVNLSPESVHHIEDAFEASS